MLLFRKDRRGPRHETVIYQNGYFCGQLLAKISSRDGAVRAILPTVKKFCSTFCSEHPRGGFTFTLIQDPWVTRKIKLRSGGKSGAKEIAAWILPCIERQRAWLLFVRPMCTGGGSLGNLLITASNFTEEKNVEYVLITLHIQLGSWVSFRLSYP